MLCWFALHVCGVRHCFCCYRDPPPPASPCLMACDLPITMQNYARREATSRVSQLKSSVEDHFILVPALSRPAYFSRMVCSSLDSVPFLRLLLRTRFRLVFSLSVLPASGGQEASKQTAHSSKGTCLHALSVVTATVLFILPFHMQPSSTSAGVVIIYFIGERTTLLTCEWEREFPADRRRKFSIQINAGAESIASSKN